MKLNPTATTALAAVVGATLMLAAPAGHAAEDSPTKMTPSQQTQGQAASFSDEELKSFASAAAEVQQLSVEWQRKLEATQDEQESQQLRQEATEEITQAVQDEGLTVEKYNQISMAARQDEQLRNKVVQYMNEQQ